MRDAFGGRAVGGKELRGMGVGAAQALFGQLGSQLLAHERMPESIATSGGLEHAGGLGLG